MSDEDNWNNIADHYFDNVLSPYHKDVSFPLLEDLERTRRLMEGADNLCSSVSIDFGCGVGSGVPLLSNRFALTIGLDFSERMLINAVKNLEALNIGVHVLSPELITQSIDEFHIMSDKKALNDAFLVKSDMRQLGFLYDSIDVAITVNSICPSDNNDVPVIFNEMFSCIKDGGCLFATLPSIESASRFVTSYDSSILPEAPYFDKDGIYVNESGFRQKYFSLEEIESVFSVPRIKSFEIKKVLYPWRYVNEGGWSMAPEDVPLWDWYVSATF